MKTSFRIMSLINLLILCLIIVFFSSCAKKADPAPTTINSSVSTSTPGTSTTTVASTAPIFDTAILSTIDTVSETSGQVSSTIKGNGGSIITQQGHVYSETNQVPTLTDDKTLIGRNDGPFPAKITSIISGLKAATTYYIRPYATNDIGTVYGTVISMKTTSSKAVATKTIDCNNFPNILEDINDGVDYLINCPIYIDGTRVVTVKPGVRVQFSGGSTGIYIKNTAALKMIGTKDKPIILEGLISTAGSWDGVQLNANNADNQWEYVSIKHAGSLQKAALLLGGLYQEKISLKNCMFTDNLGYGLRVSDSGNGNSVFTGFESNTFLNNTKSALLISGNQLGIFDSKSTFVSNGQNTLKLLTRKMLRKLK